ncbi:MAG: NapC/NirT family cytochrome c [Thermodesulfobacteriota bacterium]
MNPFEESVNSAAGGGLSLIAWVVLAISLLCIVLIVSILRRDEDRISDPFVKWALLVVFFVISPIAYLLNFSVAIEDSKKVEFCNSCHIMHGYVMGLKDPDSEDLSSVHYQYRWIADDQCFTCHSDYGLFGNMKAKMTGIRHVWAYYTGYETPVELYGTYDNGICLRCHAPVNSYQEIEEHEENADDILSSKMSCIGVDCHVKPHPEEAWKEH